MIILEATSITLNECDTMDKIRKVRYALFITERKKKEKEDMENSMKGKGGNTKSYCFTTHDKLREIKEKEKFRLNNK